MVHRTLSLLVSDIEELAAQYKFSDYRYETEPREIKRIKDTMQDLQAA